MNQTQSIFKTKNSPYYDKIFLTYLSISCIHQTKSESNIDIFLHIFLDRAERHDDLCYSFSFTSSVFFQEGRKKGKRMTKVVVKGHSFLLDYLSFRTDQPQHELLQKLKNCLIRYQIIQHQENLRTRIYSIQALDLLTLQNLTTGIFIVFMPLKAFFNKIILININNMYKIQNLSYLLH